MTERRILSIFDSHVPYNIPLDTVWEFAEDFKPTEVILGGDMHDFTAVCHWIADQSRNLDGGIIKENYAELHDVILDPLQVAVGKVKKVYLLGNHEDWLVQAAGINPNGRGYWEIDKNIDLRKYNMILQEVNTPYKASDHLYYMHGIYVNKYHAEKTVGAFHRSILYGHTHDVQEYTHVSPLDVEHYYKAASCGCLCSRNPQYLRNKPNRWVNGFNYVYMDSKTGYFNDFQVYIVKNKFWANGRFYK
jgi:hypothetical protein